MAENAQNHSCCSVSTSSTVQQSLSEMEFERGIWSAAVDGEESRVHKFLTQGVRADSVDSSGIAPLHYAARNGHTGVCRLLLHGGADVNLATRSGQATALHRAAYRGHKEVVHLLLDAKANVTMTDSDGQTALHKAADRSHEEIIKLLLSREKELVNIRDSRNRTAQDCLPEKSSGLQRLLAPD